MTLVVMRDKHEQTLTVTLPDRGSRDSSFLNLDTDELQASLANAEDIVQDLDIDYILSAADMASLDRNMALLGRNVLQSPEIEKAMRQAEKVLQDLKIGCDPI